MPKSRTDLSLDPLRRFSNRVEDYVKYRPSYPPEVIDFMRSELGLLPSHVIADIGSGTGIFTRLLLENGNTVFGVEPNAEMREAGERHLARFTKFTSVDGTADSTTLPERSVDWITAAQAFHWFDPLTASTEFRRILKPGGMVALLWNQRLIDSDEFAAAYEELLDRLAIDYGALRHPELDEPEAISRFYGEAAVGVFTCPNEQSFDFEGLRGRLLSSSYAPKEGHLNHIPMMRELRALFDRHQRNEQVTLRYTTSVHYGRPI